MRYVYICIYVYIVLNDCQRAQNASEGFRSSVYTKLYWRSRSCERSGLSMPVGALDDGVGKDDRSGAVEKAADGKKLNAIGDEPASETSPREATSLWDLSKVQDRRSGRLGLRRRRNALWQQRLARRRIVSPSLSSKGARPSFPCLRL